MSLSSLNQVQKDNRVLGFPSLITSLCEYYQVNVNRAERIWPSITFNYIVRNCYAGCPLQDRPQIQGPIQIEYEVEENQQSKSCVNRLPANATDKTTLASVINNIEQLNIRVTNQQ